MIKNNLNILHDLILNIEQFRKYLKTEFDKFVDLYCRKSKKFIIFNNEKRANNNNSKKVYREFLKTIDIKEYKRLLKISDNYHTFFYYDEECEIDIYKMRRKECKINIYDDYTCCRYYDLIDNGKIELLIFEYILDILQALYLYITSDQDEITFDKIKADKMNEIIGILYDEE